MALKKIKKPVIPPAWEETVRQRLVAVLKDGELTARDLSRAVGISEKQVLEHLSHIRRMRGGNHLRTVPPRCGKCGFVFIKRSRLKSPGKCPICRGEYIDDPKFHFE
jgi:predicted Zn-ribbon and HTH transcriptional regulator